MCSPLIPSRGVQRIFKRVLEEKGVEVHLGKEAVDVRDPPEGTPGAMGAIICKDGTEVSPAPNLGPSVCCQDVSCASISVRESFDFDVRCTMLLPLHCDCLV